MNRDGNVCHHFTFNNAQELNAGQQAISEQVTYKLNSRPVLFLNIASDSKRPDEASKTRCDVCGDEFVNGLSAESTFPRLENFDARPQKIKVVPDLSM